MPSNTKRAIKVISTLFGFATVERETVKRKTLEIWVNFGVAAPRPWGEYQNFNPPIEISGHTSKQNCKKFCDRSYRNCCKRTPDFPLTFCQNFVQKFPFPSPSPGAHHVRNLSRPPQALLPKKFWAPPDPPRGRYDIHGNGSNR